MLPRVVYHEQHIKFPSLHYFHFIITRIVRFTHEFFCERKNLLYAHFKLFTREVILIISSFLFVFFFFTKTTFSFLYEHRQHRKECTSGYVEYLLYLYKVKTSKDDIVFIGWSKALNFLKQLFDYWIELMYLNKNYTFEMLRSRTKIIIHYLLVFIGSTLNYSRSKCTHSWNLKNISNWKNQCVGSYCVYAQSTQSRTSTYTLVQKTNWKNFVKTM